MIWRHRPHAVTEPHDKSPLHDKTHYISICQCIEKAQSAKIYTCSLAREDDTSKVPGQKPCFTQCMHRFKKELSLARNVNFHDKPFEIQSLRADRNVHCDEGTCILRATSSTRSLCATCIRKSINVSCLESTQIIEAFHT